MKKLPLFLPGFCAFVLVLGSTLRAQQPPADVAEMVAAQQILYSLYPELRARPLDINWGRGSDGTLIAQVAEKTAGKSAPQPAGSDALLLAVMKLDSSMALESLSAEGKLTSQTENVALRKEIGNHPNWTPADVATHLRQINARTASDEPGALARAVDVDGIGKVMKGRMALRSTNSRRADLDSRKGVWVVDADTTRPDGSTAQFRMTYEPIGGRLIRIVRLTPFKQ